MSKIFSSSSPNIVVSQNEDGSFSWVGQFDGMPIRQVIPMEEGDSCILLLDPDASSHPVFRNLLCIDASGKVIWIAELPSSPDVFLDVSFSQKGLLTHTWSGMQVLLDRHTGKELAREFNK